MNTPNKAPVISAHTISTKQGKALIGLEWLIRQATETAGLRWAPVIGPITSIIAIIEKITATGLP